MADTASWRAGGGESFPTDAAAPAWDADMAAASRMQAMVRLGGAAAPEALVGVIGDDPSVALEELGGEPRGEMVRQPDRRRQRWSSACGAGGGRIPVSQEKHHIAGKPALLMTRLLEMMERPILGPIACSATVAATATCLSEGWNAPRSRGPRLLQR